MDTTNCEDKGFITLSSMSTSARMSFEALHPELITTRQISANINYNLLDCYNELIRLQQKFMDIPSDYQKFVATWIIGTYQHKHFNTYPFIFLNAMRGSGKTRFLKFISTLGSGGDGSVQNNISDSALFRIEKHTTTCLDEVEQIGSKEKATLRELLNAAYKRGIMVKRMHKVKRGNEEKYETECFEPFIPLALANISGLDEVLSDRSITLTLEKSSNPAVTKMIDCFSEDDEFKTLKVRLTSISDVCDVTLCQKTYNKEWNNYIHSSYNTAPNNTTTTTTTTTPNTTNKEEEELVELFRKIDSSGIDGRNFELSFPILLVAKTISNEVFEDLFEVIKNIMKVKKTEEYRDSKDVSLYEFVAGVDFQGSSVKGYVYIPIKELTQRFRMFLGEEDMQDRWLNEKWFGRALKRLGLVLKHKKLNTGMTALLDTAKAMEKCKLFKGGQDDD